MENFFIEDEFFSTLKNLVEYTQVEVDELDDNWTIKVELSDLEPMIKLNEDDLVQILADANEDRFAEDNFEVEERNIREAIKLAFDLDKFNNHIEKYYYPNGHYKTITKQDLLDFIK